MISSRAVGRGNPQACGMPLYRPAGRQLDTLRSAPVATARCCQLATYSLTWENEENDEQS